MSWALYFRYGSAAVWRKNVSKYQQMTGFYNTFTHHGLIRRRLSSLHTQKRPQVLKSAEIPDYKGRFTLSTLGAKNKKSQSKTGRWTFGAFCVGVTLAAWQAFRRQRSVFAEELMRDEDGPSDNPQKSEVTDRKPGRGISLQSAINKSRDLAQRVKDESGCPGLVLAVSLNGEEVWSEGLGYSDVENRLPCHPDTVLRIASISKSITMAAVAKLWEQGDLDLDKPVHHYVPKFPEKTWKGEKVTITTRQLVSHLSGIRHYDRDYMKTQDGTRKKEEIKGEQPASINKGGGNSSANTGMESVEYFITKNFNSVGESLSLFQHDPLVHKPDSDYLYTTHGWTLISAVVETAAKTTFEKHMKKLFNELGLENTYLEEHQPLIYNRGRHYHKNNRGRLINVAYVNLSYKWAGGGFVSTVRDLVKFGDAMLYSYQGDDISGSPSTGSLSLPGYLRPETMKMIWTPVTSTKLSWDADGGYGMGWGVVPEHFSHGYCKQQKFYVSHTGGAIGASSVLLVLPSRTGVCAKGANSIPRGVTVAIIVNMTSVSLNKTALEIAKIFEQVE